MLIRHAAIGLTSLAAAALMGAAPTLAADMAAPAVQPSTPTPAAPQLSADDKAMVQKATDYIQNLKTVEGKFTQTDPKGHVSTGVFYMQRPGKARFQYNPPAQLLVVSDGSDVSAYDRKLKTFTQFPLAQTPLMLLLADTVRLDRGVVVSAVDKSKTDFAITARDARRQTQGRITITFSLNPIMLKGWTVIDAQGQKTDVKLGTLTNKSRLDPKLFILHDPRPSSARQ